MKRKRRIVTPTAASAEEASIETFYEGKEQREEQEEADGGGRGGSGGGERGRLRTRRRKRIRKRRRMRKGEEQEEEDEYENVEEEHYYLPLNNLTANYSPTVTLPVISRPYSQQTAPATAE